MNTVQNTYINALLADASYVDLAAGMTTDEIVDATKNRLTLTQAAYLAANFEVASAANYSDIPLVGSGFDATVWRGKTGTEFAGQVFVSMRGTQAGDGGADLLADADLAFTEGAQAQITDMVNWWLREITPAGAIARQVKWDPLRSPDPSSPARVVPGYVWDQSVAGTGNLVGVTSVQVNGHSLGGHLASAFARIFGGNNYQPGSVRVESVETFNSAGFNTRQANALFTDLQHLLGTGLGSYFGGQSNYYAANGVNFTTNDTWFAQQGHRVDLYQEASLIGALGANHAMYKLTDQLALGAALEKLDSTFTIAKLNALVKAGSNDMKASYEGVLDSLRRLLLGPNITATPASDSADSPNRTTYHANLNTLTDSPAFNNLVKAGNVTLNVASAALASTAKADFGAFLSLQGLSPVVLSTGSNAAATAVLQAAHPSLYADWNADKAARLYGDTTKQPAYSDHWYTDRAGMLQALVTRNEKDIGGIVPGSQNLLYQDVASNTEVLRVLDDSTSATGKRLPCRRNEPKRLMSHDCIGFVAMNFNKSTVATCKARRAAQEVTWS